MNICMYIYTYEYIYIYEYIYNVYLDTSIILTRAHGDEIFTKRYLSTTLKQSVTGDMPLCILRSRGVAPESARYSVSDHQKL